MNKLLNNKKNEILNTAKNDHKNGGIKLEYINTKKLLATDDIYTIQEIKIFENKNIKLLEITVQGVTIIKDRMVTYSLIDNQDNTEKLRQILFNNVKNLKKANK